MDAIDALLSRWSVSRTVDPAPSDADLALMLRCAVGAPDHKSLRPWRFITIRGEARDRLGEVLAEALCARRPDVAPALVERERSKLGRAPLVVVVVTRTGEGPPVPHVERVLSSGAAAQNILLAAHALGYGGMWRTGEAAYDPMVEAALGLSAGESIAAFLYLGTPARRADDDAPRTRVRPKLDGLVSEWDRRLDEI